MAYSPSPTSPTMAGGRLPAHRSPSPPTQPLSKRDKKRNAHQERYQDLTNEFAQNRDLHFRKQLLGLQTDMMLITQADPYQPEPMDDSPEGITQQIEEAAAGTPYQGELSPHAGKWYSKFVQEVNQAKEVKEIELTQLMIRHEDNLARIKREYDFKLRLASEECDILSNTLRERIAKSLSEKKSRLVKEKEHLDIADTNAILLHPSQFSITNPSSPGGSAGNRKTRHARHRLDDDFSSSLLSDNGFHRKRKLFESNIGSPTRDGISTPAERKQAKLLSQQTAPAVSFSSLFTDKDLKAATAEAYVAATHFFATSKKAGAGANNSATNGKTSSDNDTPTADTPTDTEDLAAPEMDRTASQISYHATRSTRHLTSAVGGPHAHGLSILSDLADKVATRPTLPYYLLASYPTRQGASLPPPPPLMLEEQEEDLAKMKEMAKSKPKGWVDKKFVDELCKSVEDQRDWGLLDPRFPAHMNVHLVDENAPVLGPAMVGIGK